MKTGDFLFGLAVLSLAFGSLWAAHPSVPMARGASMEVRAWALIDFGGEPGHAKVRGREAVRKRAQALWGDAGSDTERRWTKKPQDCRGKQPRRPSNESVILRISTVERVVGRSVRPYGKGSTSSQWEAVAEIQGPDTDLKVVQAYIAQCYSHVEIFKVHGEDFTSR